MFVYHDAVNKA